MGQLAIQRYIRLRCKNCGSTVLTCLLSWKNICDVCLGTAVLYCEQLKNFYCKNCNARRHSRFPSHCFSRISQIPLPKPSAGESIYMMYLYILNWKLWRTYSKVYTLISIGEEVDSAFLTGILATLGSKIGKRRWSRWKKCYCHPAYGSGKSLCYQLPPFAGVGTAVVISPTLSLIHDQVEDLRLKGIPATYLCSTQWDASVPTAVAKGHFSYLCVA